MKLIPLPAFADNYIWMLHNGQTALVVDPGDAKPVLDALHSEGVKLQGILVTHHHADHTDGVDVLREATGAKVFGPEREDMPEPIARLADGGSVSLLGLDFQVIDVPGHTAGHIAYFAVTPGDTPILFCGDTLFSGGCGRLFEGTASQMKASLLRLAGLPGATRVCCAHEYTMANLKFAREVDPQNQQLAAYASHCKELRSLGKPTLPSSLETEIQINPFLRSDCPELMASAMLFDAAGTEQHGAFHTLRQWKNQYQ